MKIHDHIPLNSRYLSTMQKTIAESQKSGHPNRTVERKENCSRAALSAK